MPNQNRVLVPGAEQALDRFKRQVVSELGVPADPHNYHRWLDAAKSQVARDLGLGSQVADGYWGEIPARDCGSVGGRIGGKIGGQMVKRMIALAERQLSGPGPAAGPRA